MSGILDSSICTIEYWFLLRKSTHTNTISFPCPRSTNITFIPFHRFANPLRFFFLRRGTFIHSDRILGQEWSGEGLRGRAAIGDGGLHLLTFR